MSQPYAAFDECIINSNESFKHFKRKRYTFDLSSPLAGKCLSLLLLSLQHQLPQLCQSTMLLLPNQSNPKSISSHCHFLPMQCRVSSNYKQCCLYGRLFLDLRNQQQLLPYLYCIGDDQLGDFQLSGLFIHSLHEQVQDL